MKQEPEHEGLTPKPIEGDPASGENDEMVDETLEDQLARGAEPFWMQDVRLASRRIQAARARLRAAQSGRSSDRVEPSC